MLLILIFIRTIRRFARLIFLNARGCILSWLCRRRLLRRSLRLALWHAGLVVLNTRGGVLSRLSRRRLLRRSLRLALW